MTQLIVARGQSPDSGGALVDLMTNGNFETSISDWAEAWGSETLSHDTATPLVGVGSLHVETPGETEDEGAWWPGPSINGGWIAAARGVPITFQFTATGNGWVLAALKFQILTESVRVVYLPCHLTATPTAFELSVITPLTMDLSASASVSISTAATDIYAADMRIDSVSLKVPA
jgi:hypothetical protein